MGWTGNVPDGGEDAPQGTDGTSGEGQGRTAGRAERLRTFTGCRTFALD